MGGRVSILPTFSTHTTKEVLDYYWELYDRIHKGGVFDEEEAHWYLEMTEFLQKNTDNTSG